MSTYWLLVFVWFSPATGQLNYTQHTAGYSNYDECLDDGVLLANQVMEQEGIPLDYLEGYCYLVVDQTVDE